MLAAIPLLAFGAGFIALGNARPGWGWERTFIRSLILFGAALILGTEFLSLLAGITPLGLSLWWLAAMLVAGLSLARKWRRGEHLELPSVSFPQAWTDRVLAGAVAIPVVVTGIVAWLAPPNTWDSLTYHMARVAHWAQNQSVAHFATGIARQNIMSPGAEFAFLHAYVLAGGDRFVNFVQWGSMVACLMVACILARQLGGGPTARWFAAAFVATLPMGIAQASSTMTDYVVALWVACVASETVHLVGEAESRWTVPFLGAAAGLSILTKPTAFGYLLPFAIYVALLLFRRYGVWRAVRATIVVSLLALGLNVGYLGRNLATYGHPLGDEQKLATHSNARLDLRVVFSNTLRNASLHMGTPWESVNRQIWRLIVGVHFKLGMDVNDPATSIHQNFQVLVNTRNEISSGNPAHALLAVLAALALIGLLVFRGRPNRLWLSYTLITALSFVVLSSMFKFTVFESRYHVPFFVLLAPSVAAVGERLLPAGVLGGLGLGLLLGARGWLFELDPRPILRDRNGRSVLATPRMELYVRREATESLREVVDEIQAGRCDAVGVMFGGDSGEYPLWVFLGAPRSTLTIDWIVAGTPSERYRRPDFDPCAVVCDGSCPAEWDRVRQLPLRLERSPYRLFMAP